MQSRFQQMSDRCGDEAARDARNARTGPRPTDWPTQNARSIIGRIDEMGTRIDELEKVRRARENRDSLRTDVSAHVHTHRPPAPPTHEWRQSIGDLIQQSGVDEDK